MDDAGSHLGIEFLSVLGLPPVAFVELVAGLGCRQLSFAVAPFTASSLGYPAWSFRSNPGLRRDTVTALGNNGITVSLGDGFLGHGANDLADRGADLDIICELGAQRVNVISWGSSSTLPPRAGWRPCSNISRGDRSARSTAQSRRFAMSDGRASG